MGRKGISFALKLGAVEKYLHGQGSQQSIAREFGIGKTTFRQWIANYESMGPSGLINTSINKRYSAELKTAAVEVYLRGEGSLYDVCKKFNIRSTKQNRDWITLYNNSHNDQWAKKGQGRRIRMTKGRTTTLDERIEMVSFCLANGKDYGLTIHLS